MSETKTKVRGRLAFVPCFLSISPVRTCVSQDDQRGGLHDFGAEGCFQAAWPPHHQWSKLTPDLPFVSPVFLSYVFVVL
jgi:hypothetical protein